MAGALGGRLFVPTTVPIAEVIVKLAVQLVTRPFGGVPGVVCGPIVTVPVSL